ncbi:MAG: hypothetical protein IPK31_09355 [Chitinophagaceae bacterium]|nr:hypothetical protein [Chitinophagaceae bacterium]
MKKILPLLLIVAIAAFSCRKPAEVPSLTSIIVQGKWYVNLMKDYGVNNTAAFTGWQFTFQPDKVVTVTDGVNNYSGSWKEDSTRQKFILSINSSEIELIYISKEWDISLKTYGRVIFKDDKLNPSQELQFTKF